MTEKTYETAKDLIEDINRIDVQIREFENHHSWIGVSTSDFQDFSYSLRFQRELVEWLVSKKEEYQKEFNEL